jgi:hypothetical protein
VERLGVRGILGGARTRRGDPAQRHARPADRPPPSTRDLPGEWFDDPQGVFNNRTTDDVHTAKRRAGRGAPPGKVVAELSFGFWRYLLANRYSTTLWPATRHAFPQLPRRGNTRPLLERPVNDLHLLRNRIAHHEPLIREPLHKRLASLEYVLDQIDPQVRVWALDDGGRLATLLGSRP